MLFSNIPEISTGESELLAYDSTTNTASRVDNDYQALLDQVITNLVLSSQTNSLELTSHINNPLLHVPVSDSVVSDTSTWSSSKIQTAIDGSDPWFNLDSVPEGSTNQYYTLERGKALVEATSQGLVSVDYLAIASQLASVLLGYSSTVFEYRLAPNETPGVTFTVDGVTTTDYFNVTPGTHTIEASSNVDVVCAALAHKIRIDDSQETRVITPQLSLDAFVNGETNKLWNEETLGDSDLLYDLDRHINADFSDYHSPINDNTFASTNSTFSSVKIQSEILGAIASNASFTATKEVAVLIERANSGSNNGTYTWTTDNNGNGTYTHYIYRRHSTYDYRDNISVNSDDFTLRTGSWFIYWSSDETINPYFTNVTQVATYLVVDGTPKEPLKDYPGVYTVPLGLTSQRLAIVTRFTCDQPYNSTYRNTWLVPRAVPGVDEVYSVLHIERIR